MTKRRHSDQPPASPAGRAVEALGQIYAASTAGTSATAERDFLADLKKLLQAADCEDGDAREEALCRLRELNGKILALEGPRRDSDIIHQVRVSCDHEEVLFALLGVLSPAQRRAALAQQFAWAAQLTVPGRWSDAWRSWCHRMSEAASAGNSVVPFDRDASPDNVSLLALLPKLLAWEGESLVRFTSCVLCGDSKTLETLAVMERDGEFRDKLRGKLGRLLEDITSGQIRALDDLGILPNPRFALLHGPLKLCLDGEWLDLARLRGAFRLAEAELDRAECVTVSARRCLTVENETSFHELAKLQSGELLIQTSYPGSGTLKLQRRLPVEMDFWHFGDSDEAGFQILRVLREKSGRNFQPLHMQRGRIPFEQESLGSPVSLRWPFYPELCGWQANDPPDRL